MQNFAKLVDLAITPGAEGLRPVIEKEILHYDILFALDRENLLGDLTFQGGTCLRLCYESPRFSEDLDFVGGFDFSQERLMKIRECVMDHIGARYGLEVDVKNPKQMSEEKTYWGLKTDRWQVSVTTNAGRADLPRQKIKLEVANVPARTNTLRALNRNYSFLPASYQDLLVPSETKHEIMADKVVSLSACRHYIRYRDIWDLQFLKRSKAVMDPSLIADKIRDYQSEDFETSLAEMRDEVRTIATSETFRREMIRFIEPDARARTLDKPGFFEFLGDSVSEILADAYQALYEPANEFDY
ncbi:nucleotidyl transferase AbiEii/AbiGii toxin family protein [Sulfitobacter sp. 1A13353]|jgi:predicted nucleotidyltransferase component of viral defense system|uniref:nucleotidyl transferase AbiEii/AbiGii toxin family protein n=1 Tax=Sulfitobacter sp. 1A13353 TaxID=3368568 RepID=UPI003745961E